MVFGGDASGDEVPASWFKFGWRYFGRLLEGGGYPRGKSKWKL